jgi:hypothetical protein
LAIAFDSAQPGEVSASSRSSVSGRTAPPPERARVTGDARGRVARCGASALRPSRAVGEALPTEVRMVGPEEDFDVPARSELGCRERGHVVRSTAVTNAR